MLSRGCTCNTARLIPLLVSIVLCCSLLLYLSCSQLRRGSTRMNQTPKALCPPVSDNTLSLFPLFVCLPPTFTQHEHESFPCLQLSAMLHLWAPAHTANTTERNFSLLSGSFIVSNTGSLLSHSSCLHLSLPHQRNLRLSLRIGDPTQHPRGSDFIRRQLLQSRPQEQSVGGEANYLRHRVWDTNVRPLEDIAHLGVSSCHLIFQNVHLWISFVSTISCRNVHLCCLGNEAVVLFKAAINKATKVLTNWLCFPQPLFQHTS